MDIVRITMVGYGCEVNRGVIPKGKEKTIEKSMANVWVKGLFEKLGENTKIKKVVNEVGLIKGDIIIEVNGEIILDIPINSFETLINNKTESVEYPKTDNVVVTSIQHQEGVFSDTIFILDDYFNLEKLTLIKKNIKDKVDNIIIPSLYCEIYYDGELIPMMDDFTDLRMSRLYMETQKTDE